MEMVEILNSAGVQTRTAANDPNVRVGWLGVHCPYCGRPPDKFYLGWNLSRRFFSCWSCGWLPPAQTLAELIRVSVGRAREMLGDLSPGYVVDKNALRGKYVEPRGVGRMRSAHIEYLRGRGLNPTSVQRIWGVRGIGNAVELGWRLFVPINYGDEPVSWTTRALGDTTPRYVSAKPEQEKISQREILYGGDFVSHAAIVVEGPADCWAIGPGAVGLLGIGFSVSQVLKLSRIPQRLICFDAEPAAQRRARQLAEQLAPFPGETFNAVLSAKDPGSAGRRELSELRKFLE